MKKIGIVTHYYKNINYGGNLQAYALCEFLKKNGYEAEQICFLKHSSGRESLLKKIEKLLFRGPDYIISRVLKKLKKRNLLKKVEKTSEEIACEKKTKEIIKCRAENFKNFSEKIIPHSEKVYYADTIRESVCEYDAFITGSDQVFNFKSYHPIYFLDFVPKHKNKFSYAASFSMDMLEPWQKRVVNKSLRSFNSISVREKSDLSFLDDINGKEKVCVLDPTLLLETEDWDKVCSDRCVNEGYVFCYFLGENQKERELARKFSEEKNLKLVTIPHAGGGMRMYDFDFGDVQFPVASPEDFISLIKYADYIFTDSFHAVVFSHIYKRQYFIFNRNIKKNMTSRITNITKIFNTEDRFCFDSEQETLEYLLGLEPIKYDITLENLGELKEKSKKFLFDNLGK